jgi:uncharacterized protein
MEYQPQNQTEWIEYIEQTVGKTSRFQRHLVRQFKLDLAGIHGVDHWLYVYNNGIRLAKTTGAKEKVIKWFALLHDACRHTNGGDIDHGSRAATLAWEYKLEIDLDESEFDLLLYALSNHTIGCSAMADVTIQTCLDADRLDLVRIGISPSAELLYTDAAKTEVIQSNSGYRAIHFPKKMKCINCGKKLVASQPGKFRCPSCNFVIELDAQGRIYLE